MRVSVLIKGNILWAAFIALPLVSLAQWQATKDSSNTNTYYIGLNPVAAFTSVRSEFTSLWLPIVANEETGISLFVGKIWNGNYNVETRFSFGSPKREYNLLQVQSGFNYCFIKKNANAYWYAGVFVNLRSLHSLADHEEYASAIAYVAAGRRFTWKKYFLDIRLNQNVYAISWSSLPDSKTSAGFHPSIYKWTSPYVPYAGVGVGYLFR